MLPDSARLKELLTQAARQELLPRFGGCEKGEKADNSVVTTADFAMQDCVRERLARHWPEYGFLGEEMSEHEQRSILENSEKGLWCLDPLDGTSNFAAGIPFFSVSLALLLEGELAFGLVYDPLREECFMAHKGQGAWLNDMRLDTQVAHSPLRRCVAVVDYKRLSRRLTGRLARQPPYGSQRNFGSVALEWCWLAAGRFHVYLHGGQKLWDYAAGSLVLDEAGGQSVTLEGERVFCAGVQARSVIAARDNRLFEEWRHWIAGRK